MWDLVLKLRLGVGRDVGLDVELVVGLESLSVIGT